MPCKLEAETIKLQPKIMEIELLLTAIKDEAIIWKAINFICAFYMLKETVTFSAASQPFPII